MSVDQKTKPSEPESEFGRRYFFVLGIGAGMFITIAVALFVLIASAPAPQFAAEPTLPAGGADSLTVIGTEFAYDPDELLLNPDAELTLDNQGLVIHNIEIEGVSDFKIEAEAGQVASAVVPVASGEYVIFCSIPGHREAGMEGRLIVATGA